MIATLEEIESSIASLVTDTYEMIYLSVEKLPPTVAVGDVLEIKPVNDGWQFVRILPEEKERRLKKSRDLRRELKSR